MTLGSSSIRDPERARDRIGGDVVMGRPDPPGREHIVVTPPQRIEGRDDLVLDVGDDARLLHVHADLRQILGDIAEVAVFGAAGEDFVADHEHGGGYGRRFVHREIPSPRQEARREAIIKPGKVALSKGILERARRRLVFAATQGI